jgi:hypothetical protein
MQVIEEPKPMVLLVTPNAMQYGPLVQNLRRSKKCKVAILIPPTAEGLWKHLQDHQADVVLLDQDLTNQVVGNCLTAVRDSTSQNAAILELSLSHAEPMFRKRTAGLINANKPNVHLSILSHLQPV